MISNYLKIAFRNLAKHKGYSFLNMAGLSVGMAVALLIGLWLWDELSYNRYHDNYDRIGQVKQHLNNNGEIQTWSTTPYPLAEELRKNYGSDFKHVVLGREDGDHILTYGNNKFTKRGMFFEPAVTEMLSLKMLKGSRSGLTEPASVLLSASTAQALFGEDEPMNKIIRLDNRLDVKVTGIYEDLPRNSTFHELTFMAPWQLYYNTNDWVRTAPDPWRPNAFHIYAQLAENSDFDKVSVKIKDAKLNRVSAELAKKKPVIFLHPMSRWHLYSDFKNGINTGGKIQYVWLFGIIGAFVLLLACINFMNLSTARSEKRAKEVGIRKAIGSVRSQLIYQFFAESILVVLFSLVLALLWTVALLPAFNEVADKDVRILWEEPLFWGICLGVSLLTGLVAGSYPAFYLSSFNPIKTLKGTFKVGRLAAIPRKTLVVVQFTVSVTLIIGTIMVFRQIQFARNRPIGYQSNGLVAVPLVTGDIQRHFDAVKHDLLQTGTIVSMAQASSPPTEIWSSSSTFDWQGKDPNLSVDFPVMVVSHDYGKTIGWNLKAGRDFSTAFGTDTSALILNETAVRFMGLKHPVGETIQWWQQPYRIIGVVSDLVIQSPYEQVKPTIFSLGQDATFAVLKINPAKSAGEAMINIEAVFKKHNPSQPFEYRFTDQEFAQKFGNEERIGKLASFFAILAVFISCLGIFGLASFMAEQRTKEIGIRKVLGASVPSLWRLLSMDFVVLVLISCVLSAPIAWYLLHGWLQTYTYRTDLSWWVFIAAGSGALLITLLTVSFQAIKAATINPVRSLKSE
ncbi:ABC transporter permease [Arsenicibacter rosenii]|uniref:ABC transporter permease n=2 Tax=Arsenicibacter rosenii TaxID=1750698 RepID=A0A1S2VBB4_9BACT|nr:ABC transporter permease [Arsenicibacter rosenii]